MERIEISTRDVVAPFWKRVLAYIFDLMVMDFVILYPFNRFFVSGNYLLGFSAGNNEMYLITFFAFALMLCYWVLFELNIGQTPGKILFNLYVASKGKAGFKEILIRNIPKPFFVLLGLDVIYMFVKRDNRRFSEILSNTLVIERKFVLNKMNIEEGMR